MSDGLLGGWKKKKEEVNKDIKEKKKLEHNPPSKYSKDYKLRTWNDKEKLGLHHKFFKYPKEYDNKMKKILENKEYKSKYNVKSVNDLIIFAIEKLILDYNAKKHK